MASEGKWTFEFTSNVDHVKRITNAAKIAALERMGGTAETHAKKYCPVDTGRLRASITHQKQDEDTMLVGTNVEYAPYVELGHDQEAGRYVPALGKRLVASHVDGKPYIRPAIENHVSEYQQIAENEFKNA